MVRKYRRVAVNSAKKRKISNEGEYECSTASYLNLQSRRKRLENSPPPPEQKENPNPNPNPNPNSKDISTFCCSSNASTELLEHQRIHFDENENENDEVEGVVTKYNSSKERRRETTACSEFGIQSEKSSDDMKTRAEKNEETSSVSVSGSVPEKMPTESELEDFFIAAEKNIHKRFTEKYNYDIVEDVPLEGRYEWVRLNP